MVATKPICQQLIPWLRFRHKKSALEQLSDEALLTLQAEAHLVELWARGEESARRIVEHVLPLVLQRVPAACVALFQDAIAQALDWPDVARLWPWSEPAPEQDGKRLLPPPQAAPLVRRVGARSKLCAPQCVVGFQHLARRWSLAPLTGQDQSALAAMMHVAVLLSVAPPAARIDLQGVLTMLLPAMQSKVRPLVEDVLPLWMGPGLLPSPVAAYNPTLTPTGTEE